jgi:WD repeat-containing protein 1 (actin-interacting protein 1)
MSIVIPPSPQIERGTSSKLVAVCCGSVSYASGTGIVLHSVGQNAPIILDNSFRVSAISFSACGGCIAAGDTRGILKVWPLTDSPQPKFEHKVLSGPIRAIAWSSDGLQIACGGGSTSGEAACIAYDTGVRVGEVSGHVKPILSIAYRPTEPLRIVSGSEDTWVVFHSGPPFQFLRSHQTVHTGFVNEVCFSVDGALAYSCGSDGIVAMYDGESGDVLWTLGSKLPCSIWGMASLSSGRLAIACGDKTVKYFDSNNVIQETVPIGTKALCDMPMGMASDGTDLGIVSLDGTVRVWSGGGCERTYIGCTSSVVSIVPVGDRFGVSDTDNHVFFFDPTNGGLIRVGDVAVRTSAGLCVLGQDIHGLSQKNNFLINLTTGAQVGVPEDTSRVYYHPRMTPSSPVVTLSNKRTTLSSSWTCRFDSPVDIVAVSESFPAIAVVLERATGFVQPTEQTIVIINTETGERTNVTVPVTTSIVSLAIYSATLLALATGQNEILVVRNGEVFDKCAKFWTYHKSRITTMDWADDTVLVTGGVDKNIFLWSLNDVTNGPIGSVRHRDGVNVVFASRKDREVQVVSGGVDGTIRVDSFC